MGIQGIHGYYIGIHRYTGYTGYTWVYMGIQGIHRYTG